MLLAGAALRGLQCVTTTAWTNSLVCEASPEERGGASEDIWTSRVTGRHLLVLKISRRHLDDDTFNLLQFMSITQVNFPHYSQRELF